MRCDVSSLQYAIQALCTFPFRPAGAATGACLPVQWHAMRPYLAIICLFSASMRLHVRLVRNRREAVILPLRPYCAPPDGAVILGPTIVEYLPQEANGAKNARTYRSSRVVLSDLRASCAVSFRDAWAKVPIGAVCVFCAR